MHPRLRESGGSRVLSFIASSKTNLGGVDSQLVEDVKCTVCNTPKKIQVLHIIVISIIIIRVFIIAGIVFFVVLIRIFSETKRTSKPE